ncbi:hypothetical protein B0H10DRAFT_2220174 [Mycena sp. CBHHK59/15]|nr:hypothetical protein B0H10DRAFT_2220174 [Mycena sp. CBHHK59/15]
MSNGSGRHAGYLAPQVCVGPRIIGGPLIQILTNFWVLRPPWFDVFDCRGAFDVILGKPWLHSVRAIHNYENDEIQIRTEDEEAILQNEPAGAAEAEESLVTEGANDEAKEGAEEHEVEDTMVEETEAESVLGVEEQWKRDELIRIARRRRRNERERQRSWNDELSNLYRSWTRVLTSSENRPKTPRAAPIPGVPSPPAPQRPSDRRERRVSSTQQSRALKEEEHQIDEEYARISLVQTYAPWAETRFAKYLAVDTMADVDTDYEDSREDEHLPIANGDALAPPNWRRRAKRLRHAQNRLWNDTVAAALSENADDDRSRGSESGSGRYAERTRQT